jgi:hypothetical protein
MPHRPRHPVTNSHGPEFSIMENPSVSHPAVDSLRPDSFSVKLSGLPAFSTVHDITRWISARCGGDAIVTRVGPLTGSRSALLIITFSSAAAAREALGNYDSWFLVEASGERAKVYLENDFRGFSYLYCSERNPTVDLVVVHENGGHAVNSFACQPPGERLWPCSQLPRLLEVAGIFPRIMTFGWNANVWLNVQKNNRHVTQASESLCQQLEDERRDSKKRSIIYMRHDVEGLLIKQAVRNMIDFAFNEVHFENSIHACFFFAVLHYLFNDANGFAFILAVMHSATLNNRVSHRAEVKSMKTRNQAIISLFDEFNDIRKKYDITSHCFYESRKTCNMYIVLKEVAVLNENSKSSHVIMRIFEIWYN